MYSFPGKGTYDASYDPRVRPWYKLGIHTREILWGNPYPDIQDQGLILPCVTSVYDSDNKYHGVLGLEMTFDYIIETFLTETRTQEIIESYLLDQHGRIVMRSSQLHQEVNKNTNAKLELKIFPEQEVVEAVNSKKSGVFIADQKQKIILYSRIPTTGWYYVEEATIPDFF